MMNDEEQIQELYRLYWKYMIEKDVNGLHEIQSEDYFLCHMTGVKQTRAEFEKGLLNGTFNYYSAYHPYFFFHSSFTIIISSPSASPVSLNPSPSYIFLAASLPSM